ncbi:hypothetical protein MMC07_004320 [Pseudocyphellaria aurata]|nr:hypothetical protein [Pseudocyphellaria aurata]
MARADDVPDRTESLENNVGESRSLKLTWSTQARNKSLSKTRRASEAVPFARTRTRSQSAWNSVKIKVMQQSSMPDLWQKLSTRLSSDGARQVGPQEGRWPNDAEESLFCDSLLGVMRRCGRFDYLSEDTEARRKEKEKGKGKKTKKEMEKEKEKEKERKEKEKEKEKEKKEKEKESKEKMDGGRRRSFLQQLRTNTNTTTNRKSSSTFSHARQPS